MPEGTPPTVVETEETVETPVLVTQEADTTTTPTQEPTKPPAPEPKPAPEKPETQTENETPKPQGESEALVKTLRAEAKSRRVETQKLKEELEKLKLEAATEQEKALHTARKEGEEAKENLYRPAIIRAAAATELATAGCHNKEALATMLRLIDPAAATVTVDENGVEVEGLDEQVAHLKEIFPEKFQHEKVVVPAAGSVGAAGKQAAPTTQRTTEDKLYKQLYGVYPEQRG